VELWCQTPLKLVGTSTYYAEATNGLCTSFLRTAVTHNCRVVPNPTASDQTVCSNGSNTQTLTATATGNTITWYSAATGGSIVSSPTQVVGVGLTMQSHLLKLYK
jgi:hypothetical protein